MFKINVSDKSGKTYKIEAEALGLMQKEVGDIIKGEEISPDLAGYELKITGASDNAGFFALETVEGMGLKKVLLGYGQGMHKKPKGEKKKGTTPNGLRLRKTVRGKVISEAITQINTKVEKEGSKKLSEIFKAPDAETPKEEKKVEAEEPPKDAKPQEEPKETPPTEPNPEEEPKEAKGSKEEKAKPDEEPKQ